MDWTGAQSGDDHESALGSAGAGVVTLHRPMQVMSATGSEGIWSIYRGVEAPASSELNDCARRVRQWRAPPVSLSAAEGYVTSMKTHRCCDRSEVAMLRID